MLKLETEWLDAPEVRDPVLRRTWCRLSIVVGDRIVTRFNSELSDSVRDGIYVSAFPIASWLVKNWWALLNEFPRSAQALSGSRTTRGAAPHLRRWFSRHSLLSGRDGMLLPDLSIFRDQHGVRLQWFVGTSEVVGNFVSAGAATVDREAAESALRAFIDRVSGRLETSDELDTVEVAEFLANWDAIRTADADEVALAEVYGSLGLDPYDEANWDDAILKPCLHLASGTDLSAMHRDFLAATQPKHLGEDLAATERLLRSVPARSDGDHPNGFGEEEAYRLPAHEYGYRVAQGARNDLGLAKNPVGEMTAVLASRLGKLQTESASGSRNIMGVTFRNGSPGLVGRTGEFDSPNSRFYLGRAAYAWFSGLNDLLLTSGHTWHQRASRAFAAEFLAPQGALLEYVDESATPEEVDRLAEQYDVSTAVIGHQLENSGVLSL